MNSTIL